MECPRLEYCNTPNNFTCTMPASNNPNYVVLTCCGQYCRAILRMHEVCYNAWRDTLVKKLGETSFACNWTRDQRERLLWTPQCIDLLSDRVLCPICEAASLIKLSPNQLNRTLTCINRTSNSNSRSMLGRSPSINFQQPHQMMIGSSATATSTGCPGRGRSTSQCSPSSSTFEDSGYFELGSPGAFEWSNCGDVSIGKSPRVSAVVGSTTSKKDALTVKSHCSMLRSASHSHSAVGSNILRNPPKRNRQKSFSGYSSLETIPANNMNIPRGNIFFQRKNFDELLNIPSKKRNSFFICTEDDGCNGNDELKANILSHLTSFRANVVQCIICHVMLPVYDHFPLINGTFFLSPVNHDHRLTYPVGQGRFLHAVCMNCMHSDQTLLCMCCEQPWTGERLMIGGLYEYDIFAASPCCHNRLNCKVCGTSLLRTSIVSGSLSSWSFSAFSEPITCAECQQRDYHLIRPMSEVYTLRV